ncbi:MAG: acyl-CoA dehydratase activase-related protein [Myxococcales bacterium]
MVANADPEGVWGESCATEQSMPDLVQASLAARGRATTVLRPLLWLGKALEGPKVVEALGEVADKLHVSRSKLPAAVAKAAAAQREHEQKLLEIGRRALAWARANAVPTVLVCGVQHVVHDVVINATIPQTVRRNGAMSLPIDCYPIPGDRPRMPKIYWGEPKRFLRAAALCREQGDVFPLLISSFGCGPASFTEQSFSEILEGYPHTILESDGHGGTAGFVTRIQSFLRSVRQHQAEGSTRQLPDNRKALSHVEATPRTGGYLDKNVRYVFLNSVEYLGEIFAAAYRSAGYDATVADPLDAQSLACGRHDCSGKECNSYQLIWGGFRHFLEKNPSDKPTRLVQIAMQLCRTGVFPVKDRMNLERMGLGDQVTVSSVKLVGGAALTARVWAGLTASDLVRQMYLYNLAAESKPGEATEIYRRHCQAIVALMEQPSEHGWIAGPTHLSRQWRRLEGIVEAAAGEYADLNDRRDLKRPLRVVFNSGDLLTKSNDFANTGLHRLLAQKGLRVLFEPTTDFIEFLVRERPWTMFGSGTTPSAQFAYRLVLTRIRERLHAVAARRHPWLPRPAVPEAVERTARLIAPETNVGAPFTVGNVLLRWEREGIDGVVMSSCWGCDSGLIEEGLLRHFDEIPLYFHYDDASPLDERRLAGFAFRLHQAPPRGSQEPARSPILPALRRKASRAVEIGKRPVA